MKDSLPINYEILKWARVSINLGIDEVAQRLKKTAKDINNWESGVETPTFPQLEKLAYKIYKRPLAVFFFPEVPKEDTPETEFRALPVTLVEKLPSEIIRLYRKAKVFQINLAELLDEEKPVTHSLIDKYSLEGRKNIISLSNEIRNELGYSIDEQFEWNSLDIAFKNWRAVLEKKGIFVFKDAFHNDDYSGFCVYNQNYPIIYINNSMPDSRQIFTLFHELGHLLLHLGGIDFRDNRILKSNDDRYLTYERKCNKFANEILVPAKVFDSQKLDTSENNITFLANKFSVSREVILRNFLDRDLIDNAYYRKLSGKWIKEKKAKTSGGHYYYSQIAYLGNTYIRLVFEKYYQNKISSENLSSYLNIKNKNIEAFKHYAIGQIAK